MADDYKIVVIGVPGVGKSSITIQFIQGLFIDSYDPTIEDSYRKQVRIDGGVAMLDILDTGGAEEYNPTRDSYMRYGPGILLIYSITWRSSFDEIIKFKEAICHVKGSDRIPMVLVGNRCDLDADREISALDGSDLAKSWGIPFFETSARLRINIDEAFSEIVRQIRQEQNHTNTGKKKNDSGASLTKCSIL